MFFKNLLKPKLRHSSVSEIDEFKKHYQEFEDSCNSLLCKLKSRNRVQFKKLSNSISRSIGSDLKELGAVISKLKWSLNPLNLSSEVLFDVFRFLSRRNLFDAVQLVNRQFFNLIVDRTSCWPRFQFEQLLLYSNEDLNRGRTSDPSIFKNATQLKEPINCLMNLDFQKTVEQQLFMEELSDSNPLVLLQNEINGKILDRCFFFICQEESALSTSKKFFIELPNKISRKRDVLICAFWFRELSNCYFAKLQKGQSCFRGNKFSEFLKTFKLEKFYPLCSTQFKCYDAIDIQLVDEKLTANDLVLWDMSGTMQLISLLIEGRKEKYLDGRMVSGFFEDVWFSFFTPPNFAFGEDSYFDLLIKAIRTSKTPEKIVKKVRFGFEEHHLPWLKLEGLRLISKKEMLEVDEDNGLEKAYTEVKYILKNVHNPEKVFEVSLTCDPQHINEEFYSLSLSFRNF